MKRPLDASLGRVVTRNLLVVSALIGIPAAGVEAIGTHSFRTDPEPVCSASSTAEGTTAAGAFDGDRFAVCDDSLWRGSPAESSWWWRIDFPEPRVIGAILQIMGDEATSLANAPRNYVWQISTADRIWIDLPETQIRDEQRAFRIHRLNERHSVQALRLRIDAAWSAAPVVREVEFFEDVDATIPFPEWIAAVSTIESPDSLNEAAPFVALARQCPNTEDLQAQRLWMGRIDPKFVRAEPRPLALFLSGNYNDWCQKNREHWRGIEQILKQRTIPIWASCGGAQGLAILDTTGVDKPWDCPRCRDPKNPKLPVYTHIGHTGTAPCGTYDQNLAERGKYRLKIEFADLAIQGLSNPFESMESHVGQIEFVPPGWTRLVTNGPGALTANQLLKIDGAPIYAAQFHIEMQGSEESSRVMMSNFLRISRQFAANSR